MQLHQLEGDHGALLHMPFQSSYVEQYYGCNKAEDVLQAQIPIRLPMLLIGL